MNAIWKTSVYEYKRNVLRKGFLLALLSVPMWFLVGMLVGGSRFR